ncbi:MAG: sodium/proton-translocating pyrophosphatase [Fimbriimonadaceae bacterium]
MTALRRAWTQIASSLSTKASAFAVALLSLFALPSVASAAGGEGIELKFGKADQIYLYISLAFGVIAIIVAVLLRNKLMGESPGNEKMQEVGQAIREGALAYLKRQVMTMLVFVGVLCLGLGWLYASKYGMATGIKTAIAFILGVAASYIAGYAGMVMAVNGNMRVAFAAMKSYRRALEIGFHSGAVAGLLTVGLGLLGATIILLVDPKDAMIMLIGFGFGGSLAALFMRVGGGIFTKAADVGADLVGKVEAGIPEDDPRNPATIADNVGDNVGDCAGMAADVFESYEVTLVAAIVLGAATAAIFDQATVIRLIIFALMARGIGIIASILGIFLVKGSDNIDSDPLKPIQRGFRQSAAIAAVITVGFAWFFMGGMGEPIVTSSMTALETVKREQFKEVQSIRDRLAKEKGKEPYEIVLADLTDHARIKEMGLDTADAAGVLNQAINFDEEVARGVKKLDGFTRIDFNSDNPVLDYAVRSAPTNDNPGFELVSLREEYEGKNLMLFNIKFTQQFPAPKDEQGNPTGNAPAPMTRQQWAGPLDKAYVDQQLDEVRRQSEGSETKVEIEVLDEVPVSLYSNAKGDVAIGIDGELSQVALIPDSQLTYYKKSVEDVKKIEEAQRSASPDAIPAMPPQESMALGLVTHKTVPWFMFALAIVFGIIMAFAIEMLTDYYVSTHKAPTREVAGVASAGPAPMIIQGFAYAAESSVFSVFSIVVALVMPLVFFPPGEYGTYLLSFYGIALVGLGLLTTTGYILAMDTFGPISDNAQGVFEMSGAHHESPEGAKAVQRLDAAGNTTKALTKGFAIATAVVAAVALFHSYVEAGMLTELGLKLDVPEIFLGLLIGGAAPFLFASSTINAVGRASFELINEVRRQFAADKGIMAGTSKPDYARCVEIVTQAAQRELVGPGVLAIALPAAVAFGFSIGKAPVMIGGNEYNLVGAQALGGFLAGAILSGQLMAVLLANSGGMWDNAKKLIEDGMHGGKGTEAHKAGVVCDTVGDPFKDTAGPAMNPLIKVMNLVALLLVPVVIMPFNDGVLAVITGASLAALAFSIWWSKRGSLSTSLDAAMASASLPSGSSAAVQAPKKVITVEDEKEDA